MKKKFTFLFIFYEKLGIKNKKEGKIWKKEYFN